MTGLLVTAGALHDELDRERPPVVLDIRWSLSGPPGRDLYAQGHIPGAVYVDLDDDLAAPHDASGRGGRHPLPDPRAFGAAMRRAGVALDRRVVVADGRDGSVAARAWWLLHHHGHDDVRLLDGGLAAWQAAGLPVEQGAPEPPFGDDGPSDAVRFEPVVPGRSRLLDAVSAAALARTGVLLDARAALRYRGETEPVDPVAGHIPGATSSPTSALVDESGRLRPADELRAHFAALGAAPGAQVGAYCGSGVTAAYEVLALAVAGVDAALYAGSWSDWVADPGRPVAIGSDPG
jgi:thiosulfate/3-mercaptopyruvate sulfurtransferase